MVTRKVTREDRAAAAARVVQAPRVVNLDAGQIAHAKKMTGQDAGVQYSVVVNN